MVFWSNITEQQVVPLQKNYEKNNLLPEKYFKLLFAQCLMNRYKGGLHASRYHAMELTGIFIKRKLLIPIVKIIGGL